MEQLEGGIATLGRMCATRPYVAVDTPLAGGHACTMEGHYMLLVVTGREGVVHDGRKEVRNGWGCDACVRLPP